MEPEEDVPESLLSLDRFESRPAKSRKWFVFNSSPLARRIVLSNLIALAILVSGVLYLNQSQDAQVAFRRDALARQAEMLAAAIGSHADNPAFATSEAVVFNEFFDSLVENSDSIIQMYGETGHLEMAFTPMVSTKATESDKSDAVTVFFQNIWAVFTFSTSMATPEENQANLQVELAALAAEAIETDDRTKDVYLSIGGEIYIAVALPVSKIDATRGAIVVSTREGEVDSIIRGAREQILQMFFLATLSSIALSLVLANSIARPLRRLSAAAQNAHDEAGGKLNLARINIPDLSARPDEIGDLSRSMRNMTDALLDRIDENKSFAADVSHEIKNPLTSLRSAVETLSYVQDDESRGALLEVIQNDVDRLDRLVTDISNASRLEGELVRDKWEDVDISALLKDMLENFEHRGGFPDVEFIFESSAKSSKIRGLTGRLAQVFTNLISNALSFVPSDGWVKVVLRDSADGFLIIEVSDNGPGIPEENLADIFSRFYSERPVEQFGEHSGLGLAISLQIVEAHGGTIVARNTEDAGALFIVALPK